MREFSKYCFVSLAVCIEANLFTCLFYVLLTEIFPSALLRLSALVAKFHYPNSHGRSEA